MRTILICANLILAAFVAFQGYEWLSEPTAEAEVVTSTARERRASAPQPTPVLQPQQTWQQTFPQYSFNSVPMSTDNQVATTVALNIFDPERAPKTTANNNRTMAMPVNRGDMTLVGTFTIGRVAGAIILQRGMQMMNMWQQPGRNNNNNRNNNTPNAEELAAAQEQQMQEALENRAELTSLLQALQMSPDVTPQQTELLRQRLNRSNEQIALLQNQNQQRAMGRDGLSADGITATANASNSNKQYFRVGETLPNGYTLAAVTRTTATLTRNQEQIELTMQGTSTNAANGGFGMGGFGMGGFGMGGFGMGGFGDMGMGGFGMGGFGGGMDFGGGAGGFGGGAGGFGGGMDFGGGAGGFGGGAGGFGGGMDFGGGAGGFGGGFGGGAGGFGGGMGGFGGF